MKRKRKAATMMMMMMMLLLMMAAEASLGRDQGRERGVQRLAVLASPGEGDSGAFEKPA